MSSPSRDSDSVLGSIESGLLALLHADDDADVAQALRALGSSLGLHRIYVGEHVRTADGGVALCVVHEWFTRGAPAREVWDGTRPILESGRSMHQLLESGQTLTVKWSQLPEPLRERFAFTQVRSGLTVPIMLNERCWGQMGLVDCETERDWTESERTTLTAVAAAFGLWEARRRMVADREGYAQRLRSLALVFADTQGGYSSRVVRALESGRESLGAVSAFVVRRDGRDGGFCEVTHAASRGERGPRAGERLAPDDLVRRVQAESGPVGLVDLRHSDSVLARQCGLASAQLCAVPSSAPDQVTTLVIGDDRPRTREYTQGECDFVEVLARWIGALLERQRADDERARFEEGLRDTQRLESLALAAGGVAHDFNNLLTVIKANTSFALQGVEDANPTATVDALARVAVASERAAELTRQMLTFASRRVVDPEPIDLSALVGEMGGLLSSVLPRDTQIVYEFAPSLPPLTASASGMRQITMNLLKNASDALGSAGGTVTVRTGVAELPSAPAAVFVADDARAGPHVFLEVADGGRGIAPALRRRIFEPFFSTKVSGRGLGLAAVLGIVRSHRGAIAVESEPGAGTRIRIYLPAGTPSTSPRRPATRPPRAVVARHGRILVADDDRMVRQLVHDTLCAAGFLVTLTSSGEDALSAFQDDPDGFAAAVLDVTMPILSGEDVLIQLRRQAPELPVLLMSGLAQSTAAEDLPGDDITGFLPKPFDPAGLVARVRELVGTPASTD